MLRRTDRNRNGITDDLPITSTSSAPNTHSVSHTHPPEQIPCDYVMMKYNEFIVSCILDASRQVLASHGFEHASTTVDWRGEAVEYESSRKNMKILFEHRYDSGYCIVTWLYSYRPTLDGVALD